MISDLQRAVKEQSYDKALEVLNALDKCYVNGQMDIDTFRGEASILLDSFYDVVNESAKEPMGSVANKCLNLLKRSCASGELFQNAIASRVEFLERIRNILVDEAHVIPEKIRTNCLQLVANLCVQNKCNQEMIITFMQTFLLTNVSTNGVYANASAMILYNGFIYKSVNLGLHEYFGTLMDNVEANRVAQTDMPEFVSIFLEYLITESNEVVRALDRIEPDKKLLFFRYLIEYMRHEDRRIYPIHPDIFKHMLAEFKTKSDKILKTDNVQLDPQDTEEAFTLLVLIGDATCLEPYGSFLRHDGGLFLNFGCLLRQMQMLGQSAMKNMFTPVQKIEEILQIKKGDSDLDIEGQISYSLRSTVVKALANLAYKSKKNQNLAREMDIIAAILECTNIDARNPLIKEWSILAIHNLCDDNVENQQFIAGLKRQGDAENSLFTEYRSGTIRISEGKPTAGGEGK